MLILLDSTNNSACNVFPVGVNINITIGRINYTQNAATNIAPFSYTIYNFNYSNTTQIAVLGFNETVPTDADYMLVEIYDYSEIT